MIMIPLPEVLAEKPGSDRPWADCACCLCLRIMRTLAHRLHQSGHILYNRRSQYLLDFDAVTKSVQPGRGLNGLDGIASEMIEVIPDSNRMNAKQLAQH